MRLLSLHLLPWHCVKVLRKDKPKKTKGEDVTVTEAKEPELAGTTAVEAKEANAEKKT